LPFASLRRRQEDHSTQGKTRESAFKRLPSFEGGKLDHVTTKIVSVLFR